VSWTIEKATRVVGRKLLVTVERLANAPSFLVWQWTVIELGGNFTDSGFSRSLPAAQKAGMNVAHGHIGHLEEQRILAKRSSS
jgi:hypothetical protein